MLLTLVYQLIATWILELTTLAMNIGKTHAEWFHVQITVMTIRKQESNEYLASDYTSQSLKCTHPGCAPITYDDDSIDL